MSEQPLMRFDLLPSYTVVNPMFCGVMTMGELETTEPDFIPLSRKERFVWWVGRKLIEFGRPR